MRCTGRHIKAMNLNQDFTSFLAEIRPTRTLRELAITAGHTLRASLQTVPGVAPFVVSVVLQGSFRRATELCPSAGEPLEADVLVVTNLDRREATPEQALRLLRPALERSFGGRWVARGRSFTVDLSPIRLDLVLTSLPSRVELFQSEGSATAIDEDPVASSAELEAWRMEPLYIPNRECSRWEPTHPFAQIAWTRVKNANCNGHYIGVVQAIKWWRRIHPSLPRHPRSYPLEHLVGACCPDGIRSVAEGIARTFEAMVMRFEPVAMVGRRPSLPNHGVPQQDVFARVPIDEFAAFIRAAAQAARRAEAALSERDPAESERRWREILGGKFSR